MWCDERGTSSLWYYSSILKIKSSHEIRKKQTLIDGHCTKYLTNLLFKGAMVIKNKGTLKTPIGERRYITKYNIVS